MAVGMENAGFELTFANEVSPMASNTFAYNLLGVDIETQSEKVKWVHSKFDKNNYSKRLREDLLAHTKSENCDLDFNKDLSDLDGKLLVGDVRQLRNKLIENNIKDPYEGNLDLMSGGPPCQSFSLAGKRELNNYKNSLPLDFAEVCESLQPKVVLLENVKGILSAFNVEGEKHYAWFEVAKVFAAKGFAPLCMLINSKYFGIAQNRPRYIMLAVRLDVFQKLLDYYPKDKTLTKISNFVGKASRNLNKVTLKDLDFYDIEKTPDVFDGRIFPKPTTLEENTWINVKEAIDDLSAGNKAPKSDYIKAINNSLISGFLKPKNILNHKVRSHSSKIRNRFLFYQLLNFSNGHKEVFIRAKKLGLNPSEEEVKSLYKYLKKEYSHVTKFFATFKQFKQFILEIELTKKHSQRALVENSPSPAQLTIPDDICHYSPFQSRVLTVREMARIQSFPDWFKFKSKETTGGHNRRYEVPQYTQVGNAVPPKLAYHLGDHIHKLLDKIDA